eukprot:1189231-Prorocentrum_minimum.AAC.2
MEVSVDPVDLRWESLLTPSTSDGTAPHPPVAPGSDQWREGKGHLPRVAPPRLQNALAGDYSGR